MKLTRLSARQSHAFPVLLYCNAGWRKIQIKFCWSIRDTEAKNSTLFSWYFCVECDGIKSVGSWKLCSWNFRTISPVADCHIKASLVMPSYFAMLILKSKSPLFFVFLQNYLQRKLSLALYLLSSLVQTKIWNNPSLYFTQGLLVIEARNIS